MRPKTTVLTLSVLFLFLLTAPAFSVRGPLPVSFFVKTQDLAAVDAKVMPALDNALLAAEADRRAALLAAAPFEVARSTAVDFDLSSSGTWEELGDGSRLWRLRIVSRSALHLNLAFSRFELPVGAALWLYSPAGDYVEGPFTSRHRSHAGRLWTPIVLGDEVVVELHVPAAAVGPLALRVGSVQHGFRGFVKGFSGPCNNDVICPEGDPWRDQIRSAARYMISGAFLCSGQLVNNTAEDDTPYFLSAFHCDVDSSNDDSLVFFWNYESPVCGQRDGGSLQDNQVGATFLAGDAVGDFLLVELDEVPDPAYNVFYSGWDASGNVPQGSVVIHHPQGDVKAISFNDDSLNTLGWDPDAQAIDPSGIDHWEVDDWEDGTTERGSSGSCIWDPANQLCVGVLTAGIASCTVIGFDIFGKISYAWDSAGDTPETRLRDWLDPLDSGMLTLAGKDPGGAPPPPPTGDCVGSDTVLCLQNNRFQVEVERVGAQGSGPARVVNVGGADSGILWFFSADNWEMLIKVLDGCAINNHYWVFAASATAVEWTITVTDTETDAVMQYFNPPGVASPAITDTAAFATCP